MKNKTINHVFEFGTIGLSAVAIAIFIANILDIHSVLRNFYAGWSFHVVILSILLIIISYIENKSGIISDKITIPGIGLGIISTALFDSSNLINHIIASLGAGAAIYALALIYYLSTKRMGVGGGVIKLVAMLGSFVGVLDICLIFVLSAISSIIIGVIVEATNKERIMIEFGLFLCFFTALNLLLPFRSLI